MTFSVTGFFRVAAVMKENYTEKSIFYIEQNATMTQQENALKIKLLSLKQVRSVNNVSCFYNNSEANNLLQPTVNKASNNKLIVRLY